MISRTKHCSFWEIKHNLTFSFQNFGKLIRNDIELDQRHIKNTYNELYYCGITMEMRS